MTSLNDPSTKSMSDPPAPQEQTISVTPRFLNRDLEWLAFNERVLHQATDPAVPLLERVRFLSIFSSNLDEFFMKRVGGLRRQVVAGIQTVSGEDVGPGHVLAAIRERVEPLTEQKAWCYRKQIKPALREQGIDLIRYRKLDEGQRQEADDWYRRSVFPILTPLAIDHQHRFPFISNLSVSLGVMLRRPGDTQHLFARVKVPEVVEQWYRIRGTSMFVSLEEIIEHNLEDLFPGMEIVNVLPFRVTRNADIDDDDSDAEDLLAQMQAQLRERRFAPVVRLQIGRRSPRELLEFLCEELEVKPEDIYETKGLINYRTLDQIANLEMSHLRYKSWSPITPSRLDVGQDLFAAIRERDVFVHHPYDSFDDSVGRFFDAAIVDPNVLCIKQVLYRTSGDSPFVHGLIRAAESGKQIAVLIEVRARFDEGRNIEWARKLEEAGVHVAYGVVGLKTHAKIMLVIRREMDNIRCYCHIGTGNYHSGTARLYDDCGLLTCDPKIGDDVVNLFNHVTGRSRQHEYKRLLVAPHDMKRHFIACIEREAALVQESGSGRIIAKMNQLQDREVIEALYAASKAGVSIDLVVRGFCTLRAGVPGLSENIRVMSIIGRFLEHSRIFWFSRGAADPIDGDFYIGSGDWMYRNLNARVEAACPVRDRIARERLWEILQTCLADHRSCWDARPEGGYVLRSTDGLADDDAGAIGTHRRLMELAQARVTEIE
ncbi:MAG: polyphosphate kinase 1 [Planctomycetota bacterium]|jgi:polyphosphate kinase